MRPGLKGANPACPRDLPRRGRWPDDILRVVLERGVKGAWPALTLRRSWIRFPARWPHPRGLTLGLPGGLGDAIGGYPEASNTVRRPQAPRCQRRRCYYIRA